MAAIGKALAANIQALVDADLLEKMTPGRLTASALDELDADASPAAIFIHAHQKQLNDTTLKYETRCTGKRATVCPHGAMTLDYAFESDMNDDANMFGELQELLDTAKLPLRVRRRNDDGVLVDVTHGDWTASADVDVPDESVTRLVALLNEGCAHVGTDRKFIHVDAGDTTHAIVLRSPEQAAVLERVLGSTG